MHVRGNKCSIAVAVFLSVFGMIRLALAEGDPDILYVPTPQYVVNEMLEIAGTNTNDVVYDLGCGDGRFVITAAQRYGARGVGIDIDPLRIRQSQSNAISAGVADQVKFIEADLFKTDMSQASVVALYLLSELNLRLRPKLFKELKPGSRIVSHDFDMDDWEPDVSGKLGKSFYYLWIVPADVAGLWDVTLSLPEGPDMNYTIQAVQKFQKLDGHAVSEDQAVEISDIRIKGDKVSFFLSRRISQWHVNMYFKGQVKGDSMSGSAQVEGGPYEGLHSWAAVRHE